MCSYPFIVNFFQKGELILSLKVLKPLLSVVMFTMLIFSLSFVVCGASSNACYGANDCESWREAEKV